MKAILILDITDGTDLSKCKIGGDLKVYYMRDGERASVVGSIKDCPLKPMPQKVLTPNYNGVNRFFVGSKQEAVNAGWNLCIEEIEK